jgi:hypothetical protein
MTARKPKKTIDSPAEPYECAEYIATLMRELERMASRGGLKDLAYLLAVARHEAQARTGRPGRLH